MKNLPDSFLFGAHVYRVPPSPLADVFADLATMKKLGMNLVNIQESWSWDNPREGQYDFADMIALVEEAGRLGLGCSINLTMEQMPKWVWDKYPDCRLLDAADQPHNDPTQYLLPSDGKPGPCWNHAGVRHAAETFLQELVRRLDGYEQLLYWNVWQEIGLWPARPGATRVQANLGFNPVTLARFRDWLRQKFGSLDKLNEVWRTRFDSWDSVEPPRMFTAVPSYVDWKRFTGEGYLTDVVRWRAAVIRQAQRTARPIAFHTSAPYFGSTVEFHWANQADWYGTSYYPTVQMPGRWENSLADGLVHEQWASLFHLGFSRCATGCERRFIVAEAACGRYNSQLEVRAEVTPDDLRRWLLLQVAAGATATNLWNTRPEHFWQEAQGQGFLDGAGRPTPRAASVAEFGRAIGRHGQLLARAQRPVSPVALAVDEDLCRIADGMDCEHMVIAPLRCCYRLVFEYGVDADFVDINRIDDAGLAAHRAVVLPFPFAMAEQTIAKLRRYVEQGGTLLSGPTPARFSAYGWADRAYMSPAAQELFGVRHSALAAVGEINEQHRWSLWPLRAGDLLPAQQLTGAGELAGLSVQAALYVQTLEPISATPILQTVAGAVTGVTHRLGKGTAHLFGTLFGFAAAFENCAGTRAAIHRLLTTAGLQPDTQGPILRLTRHFESHALWSLLNRGTTPAAWRLDTAAEELVTGERFEADRQLVIAPGEVRVMVLAEPSK